MTRSDDKLAGLVYETFREVLEDPSIVPWEQATPDVRILWRAAIRATADACMDVMESGEKN